LKNVLHSLKNQPKTQLRPFAVKYRIQFGALLREKRFSLKKIFTSRFSRHLRVRKDLNILKARSYFRGLLFLLKAIKKYSTKGNLFIFFNKNKSKRTKFFSFFYINIKKKKNFFSFLYLYKKRRKIFFLKIKRKRYSFLKYKRLKKLVFNFALKLRRLKNTLKNSEKKRAKIHFVKKKIKFFLMTLKKKKKPRRKIISLSKKIYYNFIAKIFPSYEIKERSLVFFFKLYKKFVKKRFTQKLFFYHYSIAKLYKKNLTKLQFAYNSKYKKALKKFLKTLLVIKRKKILSIYALYAFYALKQVFSRKKRTAYPLKKKKKFLITIAYKNIIRYIFILHFIRKTFKNIFNLILSKKKKFFLGNKKIFCFDSISILNEMRYLNKTRLFKINFCSTLGYNYFLLRTEFKTRFLKRKQRKKDLFFVFLEAFRRNRLKKYFSLVKNTFLKNEKYVRKTFRPRKKLSKLGFYKYKRFIKYKQIGILKKIIVNRRLTCKIPLYFPCDAINSKDGSLVNMNAIYSKKISEKKKKAKLRFKEKKKKKFKSFCKKSVKKVFLKKDKYLTKEENEQTTKNNFYKQKNLSTNILTNLKMFVVLKQTQFCGIAIKALKRKTGSKNFYKSKFLKGFYTWLSHKSKYILRVYKTKCKMYSRWIFFFNYTLNYYLFSKLFFILVNFLFFILFNKLNKILNLLKLNKFEFCYDFIKLNSNERYVLGIKPKTIITTFNRRTKKGSP
jgi:hypothetical protein